MSIIKSIEQSYNRISKYVNHTPITYSDVLSNISGASVYLKCEHLQKTGSFKFRGALSKILSISDKEQDIVSASTGNHGLGVALASKLTNRKATIFVPKSASKLKVDAIKALNAKIEYVSGNCLQAGIHAKQYALKNQAIFVPPYNDIEVVAGQGTIGLEIKQDNISPDAVFVSVGGGGLISGIGSFIKHYYPSSNIVGCWAKNASALHTCLQEGKIFPVTELETISDATKGEPIPDTITFDICNKVIDKSVLVSEQEIFNAIKLIAEYERWIIEGSAGVAVAAFLHNMHEYKDKNVVIILCGRNIVLDKFLNAIYNAKLPSDLTPDSYIRK